MPQCHILNWVQLTSIQLRSDLVYVFIFFYNKLPIKPYRNKSPPPTKVEQSKRIRKKVSIVPHSNEPRAYLGGSQLTAVRHTTTKWMLQFRSRTPSGQSEVLSLCWLVNTCVFFKWSLPTLHLHIVHSLEFSRSSRTKHTSDGDCWLCQIPIVGEAKPWHFLHRYQLFTVECPTCGEHSTRRREKFYGQWRMTDDGPSFIAAYGGGWWKVRWLLFQNTQAIDETIDSLCPR